MLRNPYKRKLSKMFPELHSSRTPLMRLEQVRFALIFGVFSPCQRLLNVSWPSWTRFQLCGEYGEHRHYRLSKFSHVCVNSLLGSQLPPHRRADAWIARVR